MAIFIRLLRYHKAIIELHWPGLFWVESIHRSGFFGDNWIAIYKKLTSSLAFVFCFYIFQADDRNDTDCVSKDIFPIKHTS